jgi:hypothetical protein
LTDVETVEGLLGEVGARARSDDALDRLGAALGLAAELRDLGDELIDRCVAAAREQGRSWSEIGAIMGVSKQAAQQRFVPPVSTGAWPRDFDDDARALLPTAELHARRFRHRYLGTEHLLLALTENPGLAGTALRRLGVDAERVDRRIREIVGAGHSSQTAALGVAPRAKRVLEVARQQARQLNHRCATAAPEHVLLALSARRDGVAAQILGELGVDEHRVRRQLGELLAGEAPELAADILHPPRRRLRRHS